MTTPRMSIIETEGSEYCLAESASAECPDGKHVNVKWAFIGRMRQGRCIEDDRSLDCYDNVGPVLRDICRGQQRCSVAVSTLRPLARSCPRSMAFYLQTDYECVDRKSDKTFFNKRNAKSTFFS